MEHGHKRLLLVYGEHPKFDGRWIADTVRTVYKASHNHNAIRRLNINAAPMDVENFKIVKESGIGTYQCFQETYHQKTYKKVHLKGHKTDYMNRLLVHDRAFEAGIDDVGLGVLFGLYDWKFETLALLQHSFYLDEKYGVGPHTISFPRLEPALNAPLSCSPPVDVDDTAIKKIVAVIRLAIPYTGIILSTRETHELRNDLLHLGVSQISAGSRTYPGAYHNDKYNKPDMQQFTIGDSRSLDEVINDLIQQDYIPSFCTSCYRKGRTGPTFMEYAKPGSIHNFCGPNAILTLFEYITDYATSETKEIGWNLIQKELNNITDQKMREFLTKQIYNIRSGERDILL
jgi:2-iminoacetate synthase